MPCCEHVLKREWGASVNLANKVDVIRAPMCPSSVTDIPLQDVKLFYSLFQNMSLWRLVNWTSPFILPILFLWANSCLRSCFVFVSLTFSSVPVCLPWDPVPIAVMAMRTQSLNPNSYGWVNNNYHQIYPTFRLWISIQVPGLFYFATSDYVN